MPRLFPAALAALAVTACLAGGAPAAAQGTPPPLIDREILFGNPEIDAAQISPDGRYIAFLKPYQGLMNIWVKGTREPFEKARLLTHASQPILRYFWSRDARYILFVSDTGGDENYNLLAAEPGQAVAPGAKVPAARSLTALKGVRTRIFHLPRSDADIVYIGLNDRDPQWHDMHRLRLSTGERELVLRNTSRLSAFVFDNKDRLRLAVRNPPAGGVDIVDIGADGAAAPVYSCALLEECAPLRFHKDGRRVYLTTNKGDHDLVRLVLLDPATRQEEHVEADPLQRVDFGGARFSDRTDDLLWTVYVDDRPRLSFKDAGFEADYRWLQSQLPGRQFNFRSATRDENLWLVTAWADTEPGETFLLDRKARKLEAQYRVRAKLARDHLAAVRPIRYRSFDGLEISGYLTLPPGAEAKNLPLVLIVHGGPWSRDEWEYDPMAQFAANRGYAVLQANFRGSAGFGKRFLDAGKQQWGGKMQDDLTWGVRHVVAQGIADPKRVGIWGISYGGFASLAGVALTPDLYAAAVAEAAPSNLVTLSESVPPYWEAFRRELKERLGDSGTPQGRAQLARQSPLAHVAKIKSPLMITQGANDPRAPRAESEQIVAALAARNSPVEYLLAPDEGHIFARPVNRMAVIAAVERFFARHLGGRVQADMSPEVARRLAEITVDVQTVQPPAGR